ncbi:hypothetical protein LSAT2_012369 [Lamellibrachia satsuma]|nr:hypothetical protein LSAT2_012369 [Lamellibrachia satsuma]
MCGPGPADREGQFVMSITPVSTAELPYSPSGSGRGLPSLTSDPKCLEPDVFECHKRVYIGGRSVPNLDDAWLGY